MRQSGATPEEAAAIAAAIERFLRDTAPPAAARAGPGGWTRSALLGASGLGAADLSPWGDGEPWGRALL